MTIRTILKAGGRRCSVVIPAITVAVASIGSALEDANRIPEWVYNTPLWSDPSLVAVVGAAILASWERWSYARRHAA